MSSQADASDEEYCRNIIIRAKTYAREKGRITFYANTALRQTIAGKEVQAEGFVSFFRGFSAHAELIDSEFKKGGYNGEFDALKEKTCQLAPGRLAIAPKDLDYKSFKKVWNGDGFVPEDGHFGRLLGLFDANVDFNILLRLGVTVLFPKPDKAPPAFSRKLLKEDGQLVVITSLSRFDVVLPKNTGLIDKFIRVLLCNNVVCSGAKIVIDSERFSSYVEKYFNNE